jgi:hypothetical protein
MIGNNRLHDLMATSDCDFVSGIDGPANFFRIFFMWRCFSCRQPRRLRATFITASRQAGVNERYLKRSIGHRPGDIMGTHDAAVSVEEMRQGVVDVFLVA